MSREKAKRTKVWSELESIQNSQEIIEGKKNTFSKEINVLNALAKIIRSKRLDSGALNIESSEVKFQLDEKGTPIGTYMKVSQEAHQLIEEFMLLANKHVAIKMGKPAKNKLTKPSKLYKIIDLRLKRFIVTFYF